ncbi:MAG: fructose-6-phosphate aldolase [bacterium]|nr:fructose-6-phosphate aldolase [bacterium]
MKIFVDTAVPEEVQAAKAIGCADGVTTNPTLILKSGREFKTVIREMAALIEGPVLAEAVSEDRDGIVREGVEMAKWAPNVVVKIPITRAGLEAATVLHREEIRTALTLVFSPTQALLAARAGASMICPFIGRLDDIAQNGMDLIRTIVEMYANYPEITTEVVVASVRTPNHVVESALAGADAVTVPPKVIEQLMRHPLTDSGVRQFLDDWKKIRPA